MRASTISDFAANIMPDIMRPAFQDTRTTKDMEAISATVLSNDIRFIRTKSGRKSGLRHLVAARLGVLLGGSVRQGTKGRTIYASRHGISVVDIKFLKSRTSK